MKLAILFWFYKDVELCENRLRLLRRHNPGARIYGLYGGETCRADEFQARLGSHLDDFYAFHETGDSQWKWRNGDLMIAHWFRERGEHLPWDAVFVAQWDMLIFDSLPKLFPTLREGEMLLSGLRPVKEVEAWWWYLRDGSADRQEYLEFLEHVKARYGFTGAPLCCEFIVACLPRKFLERYSAISHPELGFLEYKIPIYAQIFGIPFCTDHPYSPWWADDPSTRQTPPLARILNADTEAIPLRNVLTHLSRPGGARIFHPVSYPYPLRSMQKLLQVGREIIQEELKPRWWRWNKRLRGQ